MNTSQYTTYQTKAQTTRQRRQAAGKYQRPTTAQDAAYRKSIARGGDAALTVEECAQLSTHPWLTSFQRTAYAARAAA